MPKAPRGLIVAGVLMAAVLGLAPGSRQAGLAQTVGKPFAPPSLAESAGPEDRPARPVGLEDPSARPFGLEDPSARSLGPLGELTLSALAPSVRQDQRVKVELLASQDAVRPGDRFMLAVRWTFLQPGLHVYGPDSPEGVPTQVAPIGSASCRLDKPIYPPSHQAEKFGLKWTEYNKDFAVLIPAVASADCGDSVSLAARVVYQVCSETTCFPGPDESAPPLTLDLPVRSAGEPVAQLHPEVFSAAAAQVATALPAARQADAGAASPPTRAAGADRVLGVELKAGNWPIALALCLLVGLALNFTPCVLPVIPLTVGFFLYQSSQGAAGKGGARGRVLLAGVMFSLGLVATFTVLGGLVVLVGQQFGVVFQYQGVILALGLFIAAMALGMFGVFSIQLPASVGRLSGGLSGPAGALAMGAMAAILSTPCTGPVVGGIIGWATMAPTWLGLSAFIGMGLGMATPYLILTSAPGLLDRFPRSGRWTERVKIALGFVLLGMAMWVLSGLPEGRFHFAIWSAVALAGAIWLVEQFAQPREGAAANRWAWPMRIVVLGLVVWGIARYWPAERPSSGGAAGAGGVRMIGSTAWHDFDAGLLDRARSAGRPVLLDLISDNCTLCDIMEARVWKTAQAAAALQGFWPVRANVSYDDARPLQKRFATVGTPAVVVLDGQGNLIARFSPVPFYADPNAFAEAMRPLRAQVGLEP